MAGPTGRGGTSAASPTQTNASTAAATTACVDGDYVTRHYPPMAVPPATDLDWWSPTVRSTVSGRGGQSGQDVPRPVVSDSKPASDTVETRSRRSAVEFAWEGTVRSTTATTYRRVPVIWRAIWSRRPATCRHGHSGRTGQLAAPDADQVRVYSFIDKVWVQAADGNNNVLIEDLSKIFLITGIFCFLVV